MESPIYLPNFSGTLVADTSVVTNLIATGCAANILRALPSRLSIVDLVAEEIETQTRRGKQHPDQFAQLVTSGLIDVVRLENEASRHFEDLIIGPAADTLDDGEAATVAYAIEHGIAVIDEPKAIRLCADRFPRLVVAWTTDVVLHPRVEDQLGPSCLGDAIFNALRHGRMRVLPEHLERIICIIGRERASLCQDLLSAMHFYSQTSR